MNMGNIVDKAKVERAGAWMIRTIWGSTAAIFLITSFGQSGISPITAMLSRIFAVLAISLVLWGQMRNGWMWFPSKKFLAISLSLFFWVLLSTALAPYKYLGIYTLWRFVPAMAIFMVFLLLDPEDDIIRLFMWVIIGIYSISAFYAVFQRFALGIQRPSSWSTSPPFLAGELSIAISAALSMLFLRRSGARHLKILLSAAISLLVVGVLVTESRAGIIMLAVLAIFYGGMVRRWIGIVLAAAILLSSIVIPNPISDRFRGKKDIYAFTRVEIWKEGMRMMLDHPLIGVGFGNYRVVEPQYLFPVEKAVGRYAKKAALAHNEYIQAGAEMGFPGMAIFTAFIALPLFMGFRALRSSEFGSKRRVILSFSTSSSLLSAIHSLFDFNLHIPAISVLTAFSLSLCVSHGSLDPIWLKVPRSRAWRFVLFSLGISATIYYVSVYLGDSFGDKGVRNFLSGKPEIAERYFRKAVRWDPFKAEIWQYMGRIHSERFRREGRREDYVKGIGSFLKAASLNPLDPKTYFYAASAHEELWRRTGRREYFDAARESLETAVDVAPYDIYPRYELALLLIRGGLLDKAKPHLERLVELEPNFIYAHFILSKILEKLGEKRRAEEELEKTKELCRRFSDYKPSLDYEAFITAKPPLEPYSPSRSRIPKARDRTP